MNRLFIVRFLIAVTWLVGAPVGILAQPPYQAQGLMSGEPTDSSILVQTRLTSLPGPATDTVGDVPGVEGQVRFEWSKNESFDDIQTSPWIVAAADSDYIVRYEIDSLEPGTGYHFRTLILPRKTEPTDTPEIGRTGFFRTLPAADDDRPVSLCMGSCMNYYTFMAGKSNGGGPVTATEEDKQLGYRVFEAMLAAKPDFFIGTGDIVYYDQPADRAATTLPQMRRKWHEQFRLPRLVDFFARTPALWSKDDHDFRFNDADLREGREPQASLGIDVFREQLPLLPPGDEHSPTYRTRRIGRHLQLWLVEGRDYRDPNKKPDGPEKSLWGEEQKRWLRRTLQASDATWKVIISPTPMVGPDDHSKRDNHANLEGFRHEADEFFAWVTDQKLDNLLIFCGDRHWQYHSVHPSGVHEFGCGALNDENSRRGVLPGSPKGTDPEGRIAQPYLYDEPTGGFLHLVSDSGRLIVSHHDDFGRLLHRSEFPSVRR